MKYIPHYDQNTAIRHGTCPTAQDISARAMLLKEKGVTLCGEMLLPNKGYVPVFEGPVLIKDEQNLLCLDVLEEQDKPTRGSNENDAISALIEEYKSEFLRVNRHAIDVQQDGTQILINGEATKTNLVERFLTTLKARRV